MLKFIANITFLVSSILAIYADNFIHFELFVVFNLVKQQYELGIYYNLDDFSDWVASGHLDEKNGPYSFNIYMLGEKLIEDKDTAEVAQRINENQLKGVGAIASVMAAINVFEVVVLLGEVIRRHRAVILVCLLE